MVTGRSKGLTFRGKGNVVLVAAQLDDPDGNPTEEYVLLRADEFGRLRTIDAGAVATFLGLTDTPASYAGSGLLGVRVNGAEDALEFAATAGGTNDLRQVKGLAAERWSVPGWFGEDQATSVIVAGEMSWTPIRPPQTRTHIRIGIEVSGGGGGGTVARLGIYNAVLDADGLRPGTLLLDAGTVPVNAAGSQEIVIAQELTANTWYFIVFVTDGTPTVFEFDEADAVSPVVSGFGSALSGAGSGDMDLTTLTLAGQGIGALLDPSAVPTGNANMSRAGIVRLRDI